jgi:regulatory protein
MSLRRITDPSPSPKRGRAKETDLHSSNESGAGNHDHGMRDRTEGTTRASRRPKLEELSRSEQIEQAKNTALNTLSMVAKTRGELAAKLTDKGYPEDVIDEALDRLTEVGLINDAAYARDYAASRQRGRGLSSSAIRRELQRKKLAAEHIDDAVADISPEDEYARALELVQRKAPSTRSLPVQARIRRLAGMLIRRGYPAGIAFAVVKESLAAEGAADVFPTEPDLD